MITAEEITTKLKAYGIYDDQPLETPTKVIEIIIDLIKEREPSATTEIKWLESTLDTLQGIGIGSKE